MTSLFASEMPERCAVETQIVRTLETLSRRVRADDLPGLPGAKRADEEVLIRAE